MIYKQFSQDAKTALRNIGGYAWTTIAHMVKYIVFCVVALALALGVGALIVQYPLYSAIAGVLGAVGTVFMIELNTVRWVREQEEKQEAWFDEMRKPAHGEPK